MLMRQSPRTASLHFRTNLCICLTSLCGLRAGNLRGGKPGWFPGTTVNGANNNVVNCLVHNAFAANVPSTYTPPCGGTLAVVMLPCDIARATGRVRAQMIRRDTYDQITVTQVPVPCECVVSVLLRMWLIADEATCLGCRCSNA